jgi:hypothetical protein
MPPLYSGTAERTDRVSGPSWPSGYAVNGKVTPVERPDQDLLTSRHHLMTIPGHFVWARHDPARALPYDIRPTSERPESHLR